MIHVFIGTKAQYIKTAPLLRLMDERQVPYRLIDSGQHAALSQHLRQELGVREPDVLLGGRADVQSIPQALRWMLTLALRLLSRRRIRDQVFAGQRGVCVVHGDTPSTLLSTLMAKRAGLVVAHLEAGLRSHNWFHPFPEELIRMVVMRLADVLFAPDTVAAANLADMKVRGEVVLLAGNTSAEALAAARPEVGESGPVVVTMHRVENLHRASRRRGFVELVVRLAEHHRVCFVMHGPTGPALEGEGIEAIRRAGVEVSELLPHGEFVRLLAAAPLVVTDGGSIQEECALLGVPTLLWRDRTERPDGLGENVVLSRYDAEVVEAFVADPAAWRRPPRQPGITPSAQILDCLDEWR